MLTKLFVTIFTAGVVLPSLAPQALAADSREYRQSRSIKKYVAKKRRIDRDESYAARANNLDPAGDYKGYPDWARVALSPKYDNGFR